MRDMRQGDAMFKVHEVSKGGESCFGHNCCEDQVLVDKIDKEEKADVHKKCAHERRIVVRKRCEGRLE